MKKYISLILVLLLVLNIICPYSVFASDDKTVLSKDGYTPMSYSYSEAYNYVSSHKDIYYSDGVLALKYTPTNTYNWTCIGENGNMYFSDKQVVQLLQCKNKCMIDSVKFLSLSSNNTFVRSIYSLLGMVSKSDVVGLVDLISSNYNYLDAIDYNEDSNELTFDSSLVQQLQTEIKKYYYDSIGAYCIRVNGTKPESSLSDFCRILQSLFNCCGIL